MALVVQRTLQSKFPESVPFIGEKITDLSFDRYFAIHRDQYPREAKHFVENLLKVLIKMNFTHGHLSTDNVLVSQIRNNKGFLEPLITKFTYSSLEPSGSSDALDFLSSVRNFESRVGMYTLTNLITDILHIEPKTTHEVLQYWRFGVPTLQKIAPLSPVQKKTLPPIEVSKKTFINLDILIENRRVKLMNPMTKRWDVLRFFTKDFIWKILEKNGRFDMSEVRARTIVRSDVHGGPSHLELYILKLFKRDGVVPALRRKIPPMSINQG
jgi:hypothetical protein